MNGHVIPRTPIAVDFWKIRHCPNARLFFLSHLHGDHTVGLTSSWQHPIYCSPVTAQLLAYKFSINPALIKPLELNTAHMIFLDCHQTPMFTVTLFDANHCPGSVMFFFEGYFGNILYTGDFRYKSHILPLSVMTKRIDILYLDNTYGDITCQFPSRDDAKDMVLNIIRTHPTYEIFIGLRKLGKEKLLIDLALDLCETISIPEEMYHTMCIMGAPNCFTKDNCRARIKVLNFQTLKSWHSLLSKQSIHRQCHYISIIPTALYKGVNMETPDNMYIVPYSDHSSYNELCQFLSEVRPKIIYPVVERSQGCSQTSLKCFEKFLSSEPRIPFQAPENVQNVLKNGRHKMDNAGNSALSARQRQMQRRISSIPNHPKGVVFDSEDYAVRQSSSANDEPVVESNIIFAGNEPQNNVPLSGRCQSADQLPERAFSAFVLKNPVKVENGTVRRMNRTKYETKEELTIIKREPGVDVSAPVLQDYCRWTVKVEGHDNTMKCIGASEMQISRPRVLENENNVNSDKSGNECVRGVTTLHQSITLAGKQGRIRDLLGTSGVHACSVKSCKLESGIMTLGFVERNLRVDSTDTAENPLHTPQIAERTAQGACDSGLIEQDGEIDSNLTVEITNKDSLERNMEVASTCTAEKPLYSPKIVECTAQGACDGVLTGRDSEIDSNVTVAITDKDPLERNMEIALTCPAEKPHYSPKIVERTDQGACDGGLTGRDSEIDSNVTVAITDKDPLERNMEIASTCPAEKPLHSPKIFERTAQGACDGGLTGRDSEIDSNVTVAITDKDPLKRNMEIASTCPAEKPLYSPKIFERTDQGACDGVLTGRDSEIDSKVTVEITIKDPLERNMEVALAYTAEKPVYSPKIFERTDQGACDGGLTGRDSEIDSNVTVAITDKDPLSESNINVTELTANGLIQNEGSFSPVINETVHLPEPDEQSDDHKNQCHNSKETSFEDSGECTLRDTKEMNNTPERHSSNKRKLTDIDDTSTDNDHIIEEMSLTEMNTHNIDLHANTDDDTLKKSTVKNDEEMMKEVSIHVNYSSGDLDLREFSEMDNLDVIRNSDVHIVNSSKVNCKRSEIPHTCQESRGTEIKRHIICESCNRKRKFSGSNKKTFSVIKLCKQISPAEKRRRLYAAFQEWKC